MAGKLVTFKFKKGQAQKWANKVQKENNKAISATLNELSKVGIRETAQQLQEETGVNQSSVRKRITVGKANIFKHFFTWFIRGRRLSWIQPRVIKGGPKKRGGRRLGLTFLADNKVRKRVTGPQNGGTPPFLARMNRIISDEGEVKRRGNLLPFYRDKKKDLHKLVGHSLPWLLHEDWEERIKSGLVKLMPTEYRKQLKKLQFSK